jgi:hypothetical protein
VASWNRYDNSRVALEAAPKLGQVRKPLKRLTNSSSKCFQPKPKLAAGILALVACVASSTRAQIVSSFLPSNRTVDWSHVGIPGGIPDANWPICQTISPSGGADDSVTIQNALNSCPAGSVVVLGAGTYTLHRTTGTVCHGKSDDYATGVYEAGLCLTDKSIVLRGAGPNNTVLNYGDGASIISMGETYLSSNQVSFIPVTSTALQGATTLTLSSVSGITVNGYIVITQTNPTDTDGNPLINTSGYTGTCSGCGHNLTNNQMQQIDQVTAISGDTVTLARPLYFNYSTSPQVFVLPMVQSVGLENLRVVGTAASGTELEFKNINIEACAKCWVHNVESDWAVDKSNIYLSDTYENEISNNYLFEAFNHDSGADYSLLLEFRNSEDLIQNNIIRRARHSTPESGGAGNVYAYNYEINAYMGEYHNSLPETQTHAPHPYMNLWEGNVTSNWEFDFAHGSSSHNTMFRNYLDMTALDPDTNQPMTGGLIAINVAYYSNYVNLVGNVFGPYGSACKASVYETDSGTAKVNGVIYQLGYYDDGGGSSPNAALSAKVGQTILRGGNWDCVTKAAVWNNNVPSGSLASSYLAPQSLPNSLVFTSAPSYFSATGAVWPPINTSASTVVNSIPAQICYNNGPVNSLGGGFNPTSCYASSGVVVEPPTDLSAVVH